MKQYEDNCAAIENSLPLYVGGDLEEPAASEVARHLAECAACSARLDAARAARDLMVSALVLSERRGPELWPLVRAGLVREGVLVPEPVLARPSAPRRSRLLPYAAAAAALLVGFWLARTAFDGKGPFGEGSDQPAEPPVIVKDVETPAPQPPLFAPVTPVVQNKDGLRLVGKHERRLSEGAEIYNDLPVDPGLDTNIERWTTTPVLRRP